MQQLNPNMMVSSTQPYTAPNRPIFANVQAIHTAKERHKAARCLHRSHNILGIQQ